MWFIAVTLAVAVAVSAVFLVRESSQQPSPEHEAVAGREAAPTLDGLRRHYPEAHGSLADGTFDRLSRAEQARFALRIVDDLLQGSEPHLAELRDALATTPDSLKDLMRNKTSDARLDRWPLYILSMVDFGLQAEERQRPDRAVPAGHPNTPPADGGADMEQPTDRP